MYHFYFDDTLLPIAPESIKTKVGNGNKTYNLIDGGEINVLKSAKLATFEFDVLLPNTKYPFAIYEGNYQPAGYYLDILEKYKSSKKPFQFKINRAKPDGTLLFMDDVKVSLEEYTINEDADNGTDVKVSIKLKQYKEWSTTIVKVEEKKVTQTETRASGTNDPTPTNTDQEYTIQSGDTLWGIAKSFYGDGSLCYKLATYNSISNPNLIYSGDKLKIPPLETLNKQTPTYGTVVQKTSTPTVNTLANYTYSGDAQKDAAATATATMHAMNSAVSSAKTSILTGR